MAGNLDSLTFTTVDGALQLRGGFYSATLTGALDLDLSYGNFLVLDPGGSNRNVDFIAAMERDGAWYMIRNAADAAENLVVRDSADATIVTLNQNEAAMVAYTGSAWILPFGVLTVALS